MKLIYLIIGFISLPAAAFELIDGSAQVSGNPAPMVREARASWTQACDEWKKDTKDINKGNLISVSCNSPTCEPADNGAQVCSSTATYRVKTEGTLSTNAPPAPPAVVPTAVVVERSEPQVVYESYPVARPGFLWIVGGWSWRGGHRYWAPGHWVSHHSWGYHHWR